MIYEPYTYWKQRGEQKAEIFSPDKVRFIDRFIQHLIDEHLSSIPAILEQIKKTIAVQKGDSV